MILPEIVWDKIATFVRIIITRLLSTNPAQEKASACHSEAKPKNLKGFGKILSLRSTQGQYDALRKVLVIGCN
jgi:hypothetical protein